MPRKGHFSQPACESAEPQRRVIDVMLQPHRPGWYTLVWREGGQVRRQHLSRDRCLAGLAEVAGNPVLEELWGWRLAQLPPDPRGPGRPTGAHVQAEPVASTPTRSRT